MLKKFLIILSLSSCLLSCKNKDKTKPVTDVEVATTFIRDILDNKFKEAENYLLVDETNKQYFDRFQQQFHTQDKAILAKYKNADIIVNDISYITDSICIFNYSNSYSKEIKTKLKVVRVDKKWQIDLKYTFSENQ